MNIKRKNLQIGKLYFLQRRNNLSDCLIIWKCGPEFSFDDVKNKEDQIDRIYLNKYNPFCFLGCYPDMDLELDTTFWYKILTKQGKVGYFVLCDEELEGLGIKFYEAN